MQGEWQPRKVEVGCRQSFDLCVEGEVRKSGDPRGSAAAATGRPELVADLSLDKDMLQAVFRKNIRGRRDEGGVLEVHLWIQRRFGVRVSGDCRARGGVSISVGKRRDGV